KAAMPTLALLGTVLGLSFTSGLNLYATVLATGLFLRLGWIVLPPAAAPLGVLAHSAVLITAGALYGIEFLADKVPVVDHAWDVVHSFVRPLGAAALAWEAAGAGIPDAVRIPLALAAGGLAFSTHAG